MDRKKRGERNGKKGGKKKKKGLRWNIEKPSCAEGIIKRLTSANGTTKQTSDDKLSPYCIFPSILSRSSDLYIIHKKMSKGKLHNQ